MRLFFFLVLLTSFCFPVVLTRRKPSPERDLRGVAILLRMDMTLAALTRILEVLRDLGEPRPGLVELTKYLFLVDANAVRVLGRQVTEVQWRRFQNGPWSPQVNEARDELQKLEVIAVEQEPSGFSKPKELHALMPEGEYGEMGDADLAVLTSTVCKYASLNRRELEKLAYATEPMLAILEAEERSQGNLYGEPLDMGLIPRSELAVAHEKVLADG
ncbi:MAG: Panacea domain-containing protein [Planctomycetota bacterium]